MDNKKILKDLKKQVETKTDETILLYKNEEGEYYAYPILLSLQGILEDSVLDGYVLKFYKDYQKQGSPKTKAYFVMKKDDAFSPVFEGKIKYKNPDSKGLVNLGYDLRQGKNAQLFLGEGKGNTGHVLVGGGSGSGKSVLLGNILKQNLESGANVIIVEKGTNKGPAMDYINLYKEYKDQIILYTNDKSITSSPESVLNFLLFLQLSIHLQGKRNNKLIMLLDEFQSLYNAIKNMGVGKKFMPFFKDLMAKARADDVNMIFGTQNLDKKNVPRVVFGNLNKMYIGQLEGGTSLPDLKGSHLPEGTDSMNYLFHEYSSKKKRVRAPFIKEMRIPEEKLPEIAKEVGDYYSVDVMLKKIKKSIKTTQLESIILNKSELFLQKFFQGHSRIQKELKKSTGYFVVLYFLYKITVILREKRQDLNMGDFSGFEVSVMSAEYLKGLDKIFERLFFISCFENKSDIAETFKIIKKKGRDYNNEYKREEREGVDLETKLDEFEEEIIRIVRTRLRKKYVPVELKLGKDKVKNKVQHDKEKESFFSEDAFDYDDKEDNAIPDESELNLIDDLVPK